MKVDVINIFINTDQQKRLIIFCLEGQLHVHLNLNNVVFLFLVLWEVSYIPFVIFTPLNNVFLFL